MAKLTKDMKTLAAIPRPPKEDESITHEWMATLLGAVRVKWGGDGSPTDTWAFRISYPEPLLPGVSLLASLYDGGQAVVALHNSEGARVQFGIVSTRRRFRALLVGLGIE